MAVDNIAAKTFRFKHDGNSYRMPYDGNINLNSGDADIEKAVVIIHGTNRDSDVYAGHAIRSATRAGEEPGEYAVIAPQFLRQDDIDAHKVSGSVPRWTNDGWKSGDLSRGGPGKISSYEVLDKILERLADKAAFPDLDQVVVAGHSAGGQFVARYAAGGDGENALADDQAVRYVIANPSSYLMFDDAIPYKYGLANLNTYMGNVGADQLKLNFGGREVKILLGERDNNPNHSSLDTSKYAMLQGDNRLDRGWNYWDHLEDVFDGSNVDHGIYVVPGVGHSGGGMFTHPVGQTALWDDILA